MCGIAGIFDYREGGKRWEETCREMLKVMKHRGPDHSACYLSGPTVLGHNRLKIIDLENRSNQPFLRFGLALTFNGEIYNYREIRKELIGKGYRFETDSDTEVVLVAFKEWGEACVKHFMGMWAFAIWNEEKKSLFCSRDRFGIKPFYYIDQQGIFAFASEMKALKQLPYFRNEINEMQVYRGLQLGWTHYEDETYYKMISALPAGTNMLITQVVNKKARYWDLSAGSGGPTSPEEAQEKFKALFTRSMEQHSISDVPVGACLSGGIDSSAVVSLWAQQNPQKTIKTFTIYYDGNNEVDERPWVNHVLNQYKNVENYAYKPSDDEIANSFLEAQQAIEVPLTGSSPVSQYLLMKMASQHQVKVLLDGQGADEYLAGYMHTFDRYFGQMLRKFQWVDTIKGIYQQRKNQGYNLKSTAYLAMKSLLMSVRDEQQIMELAYRNLPAFPALTRQEQVPFRIGKKSELKGVQLFLYDLLFTTSLPTILHYEDRNSMRFSMESRVPFLDHRLVEYAFQLPDDHKIKDGTTKDILRQSLRNILPDAIAQRKDKKGFVTPGESKWLKGPLKEFAEVDFRNVDFIDNKAATKLISLYQKNKTPGQAAWRLISLNHWLKSA